MVSTEQMNRMKQLSLAETGFLPKAGKQTRKAVFLAEMEQVVPWSRLEGLIEPFYPKRTERWAAGAFGHDVPFLHQFCFVKARYRGRGLPLIPFLFFPLRQIK